MHLGRHISAIALLCSLSACAQSLPFLNGTDSETETATAPSSNFTQVEGEPGSEVIAALLDRRSFLEQGSSYGTVGLAAITASSRSSEAELTSAKLRAEAKAKNWLPTIGPSISLTSLGDLVAGILIEQVLFDNGRRKAEREFAAADVEVAAVNLSIDMNNRVETAVALYVSALKGDEKAALGSRALQQMQEFERIVSGRVEGGVSDRADLRVVQSKIGGMRSARATAHEAAATSRAELKALTGQEFATAPSRLSLGTPPDSTRFLTVLKASAEANRSVAQTKVERAGLLPQISAAGSATNEGSGAGLTLDLATPLGLGTPALLKAIESARETAERQVAEAEEDARRNYGRQTRRLASFRRQQGEAATLARSSYETYRLFQAQFDAGQRSVLDVVAIYEEWVQREQAHIDSKYQVLLIQLELGRDLGVLADGDMI